MSRITAKQYEDLIVQIERHLDYFTRLTLRCQRLKMPSDYPLASAASKAMAAVLELRDEAQRLRRCEIERQEEKRKRWRSYGEPPFPPPAA